MRSTEYLHAVEEALQGYDDEMVKELIASLNEHFEQGLSAGRSEEELCAELGAVENLVKELDAMGGRRTEEKKVQTEAVYAKHTDKAEKEPFASAVEKTAEVPGGDTGNAAHTETALVKRVSPKGYPVSKIHAELGFADIKLLHTDKAIPYIRLQRGSDEPESVRLEEYFNGDTYEVRLVKNEGARYRENRSIWSQIFVGLTNGAVSLGLGVHLALELYIPAEIRELCVKQSSGDISGDELNIPVLKLTSGSGDIDLKNVRAADALETRSASGDVTLENIVGTAVTVSSTSGDLNVQDVKAVNMTMHSTSGDLDLDSCIADERLGVNTGSGDIDLNESHARRLAVNTISGDATVCVRCAEAVLGSTSGDLEVTFFDDVDARMNTVSGDANVRLKNDRRGFYAETHTVSGDVHVRYAGSSGHYGKNAVIHIGGEASHFEIHSVSGDIRISE